MRAPPNHKFAYIVVDWPTYQRTVRQDLQRLNDFANSRLGIRDVMAVEVCNDPIEVIRHLGCEFDASHCYRASFLGTGRGGCFPAARCSI